MLQHLQHLLTPTCTWCTLSYIAVGLAVVWYYVTRPVVRFTAKDVRVAVPEAADESEDRFTDVVEKKHDDDVRRKSHGGKVIRCFDPSTGEFLGNVKAMSPEEVQAKVDRAREAQKAWAETTFEQRREVLRLMLDYVVENQELICQIAARDSGKTLVDGCLGEILTTCEKLRWTLAEGEKVLKPQYRSGGMVVGHKRGRVEFVPLGVLAAIVSWNYPFHNMTGPIISAIFAGNGMVVKASEYVSWSAEFFINVTRECLRVCGHDPEIVQLVTGYGEAGKALVQSGVDKVTFIGSPGVGKHVMRAAADNLTPVVLELGGKDPGIVCEDCDFGQVVDLAMRGVFQNCGQNCAGMERIIVLDGVYDRFVEAVTPRVRALTQGPAVSGNTGGKSFDCGSMTMITGTEHVRALVDDAVRKGARLLAGGKPARIACAPNGQYFEPTLLVDVTNDMLIATEEVFGPVMCVFRARDDDHAIEIANGTPFGLGSSVFTLDTKRGEKIMKRLRSGMSNLNDFGVNYLCQGLPFGGVNDSGFDRFAGEEGLRGCCLMRAVTTDKFPGVRTQIPPLLNYPIKASGWSFAQAMISVLYAPTLMGRAKAALQLGKLSIFGGKGDDSDAKKRQ